MKRVLPLHVFPNTSGNIVGITSTVQQLRQYGVFHQKRTHFVVADIAICYKWWLRSFSQHALGQTESEKTTFFVWYMASIQTSTQDSVDQGYRSILLIVVNPHIL